MSVPEIVKTETADEGKACGYADPPRDRWNVKTGKIRVEPTHTTPETCHIAETQAHGYLLNIHQQSLGTHGKLGLQLHSLMYFESE